ncbi:DUF2478 domain-containing protein [Marivivens marinus]|uniref:DUF2478 domain-containing protein n=1 Tax=Marivivens marinus TaxID=3110173 RepID=UPI003B84B203
MRLGVIRIEATADGADPLLAAVADRLGARGISVAGAVQVNTPGADTAHRDMDLTLLPGGGRVRISQNLGPGASGCRLDPAGLAEAVAYVEGQIATRPGLIVVNKFGKEEAEGRGFRPLIGAALAEGIPVLTAVADENRPAFDDFAQGLAEDLLPDSDALMDWATAGGRTN